MLSTHELERDSTRRMTRIVTYLTIALMATTAMLAAA